MRKLLDNSTKRRLAILEQLNDSPDWISSSELAERNNASLRTINSDVQFLKENWYPNIIIETSKKNGVRLSTPPSSHAQIIYRDVVKNSEAFTLLEKIFFDPTINLEDWEERVYISQSSLHRLAGQISLAIKKYNLVLEKKPMHIANIHEIHVRYFFTSYFNEIYFIHSWPFDFDRQKIIALAQALFDHFFGASKGHHDDMLTIYLTHLISVSLTRYRQGFLTDPAEWELLSEEDTHVISGNHGELKAVAEELGLELNDTLMKDLMSSIYFFKKNYIPQSKRQLMDKHIQQFIDQFQEALFLEMDPNSQKLVERVLTLIFLHHQEYPFKDPIIFDKFRFNAAVIAKNYPNYTKLLEYSLRTMEKETNFPWYSMYFSDILYWIMVKWHNLPIILEKMRTKVTILVLTDHGSDHAVMLASLLEKNFGQKAQIFPYTKSILTLDSLSEETLAEYDLFVTNFISSTLPKHQMVVVNTFPIRTKTGEKSGWLSINSIGDQRISSLTLTNSFLI